MGNWEYTDAKKIALAVKENSRLNNEINYLRDQINNLKKEGLNCG